MRPDYLFKVVKSKSENLEGIANKELVIEVRCIQGNIGNLYLKLKISDSLTIDSVLFMNPLKDYLTGFFELRNQDELSSALRDLLTKLNKPLEDYTFLSVKWERFSKMFREWFNTKLIPLLEKEFEISQLIFEE
ncbi:hypothetical protein Megpolyxen_01394 [Candidatus Megaera polyxenophila]|nr:hypothetical protein Megpolyxen_01394 [Candidatus Megaera polyxenophila]